MNQYKQALQLHKKLLGKFEIKLKTPLNKKNLALLYTPGVAAPCLEIAKNKKLTPRYTMKSNTIAIVTDGTAVLGLGDIGPEAALPVMEGKAILFKEFGDINAIPICLNTKDTNEIIKTVIYLEPGFGGINLEDISSPRCFEIEEKLNKILSIPVFHDDQHGTAIVVYAGLINALKLAQKKKETIKVVINGAGAAGIAVAKFLLDNQIKNIILCDRQGIIYKGRQLDMNIAKEKISLITNKNMFKGKLNEALINADVFIGLSSKNILTRDMINKMHKNAIIFALANPDPEILPSLAKKAGIKIIATGRSDYPNQVNNLLAFPGIFKGALAANGAKITFEMKKAAAETIAKMIPSNKLSYNYFIPNAINKLVAFKVANAVKKVALNK